MQFLSSLIRLVQFQRHLKLSRWLIRQDIQQSAHTDQVETADTTIADLAVALNTCQIKTGAPSRSGKSC